MHAICAMCIAWIWCKSDECAQLESNCYIQKVIDDDGDGQLFAVYHCEKLSWRRWRRWQWVNRSKTVSLRSRKRSANIVLSLWLCVYRRWRWAEEKIRIRNRIKSLIKHQRIQSLYSLGYGFLCKHARHITIRDTRAHSLIQKRRKANEKK